jgi:hypothetical protein
MGKKINVTFPTVCPTIAMSTVYGDVRRHYNVEMHTSIGINSDGSGWYETYDSATGGDMFYAEGVLHIGDYDSDIPKVIDYDGCFELPDYIVNYLKDELGIEMD